MERWRDGKRKLFSLVCLNLGPFEGSPGPGEKVLFFPIRRVVGEGAG